MLFLRRLLWISYKDRVTNEEVIHRANIDRTLMKDIVKRQTEFFGQFSDNRIHRREKARGRQRETYLIYLQNMKGMAPIELFHLAYERCVLLQVAK